MEPEDLVGLELLRESRGVFLEEQFEQFPAFAEFQSAKKVVPMPDRPLLECIRLGRVAPEHVRDGVAEFRRVKGVVEIRGIRRNRMNRNDGLGGAFG